MVHEFRMANRRPTCAGFCSKRSEAKMRRVFIVLVLTVAGMGVSSGKAAEHADANSNDKTKKEVLKVEQELQQAILKDATNILDRTFADEMVWLTSTGRFLTKSEVLADIHSRNLLEFS